MFKHRFDQSPDNLVAFNWFVLSFNGGCINALGFLGTGRFVSHVTGFATLFGVELSRHRLDIAMGVLSVPLFFLMGVFTAGSLIDRPIRRGEKPHFGRVMFLSAICLFLEAGFGRFLQAGNVGEFSLLQNYILMALPCLACGLQNGAITSSSGHSVRTTHLTGLTTDLGLGLARVFDLKRNLRYEEMRTNYLRLGSIVAFIIGSSIGAWLFIQFDYRGFLLCAFIATYASWQGKRAGNI